MSKINVVLFMGGDSGEYEVSIASASQVKKNLDPAKFDVFPVLIRNGNWIYTDGNGIQIPFDRNMHCLLINSEPVYFDCAFIAIHGTPGEDGKLQGYLDIAGIPYTTCDVTTSALTFNKYFCNDLAIQYGVKVAGTVLLRQGETYNADALAKKVGMPCFIKPNKAGSSVGVSKVYDLEGIPAAVAKAFAEDDEVLVQQFIKGREMACGVFTLNGKIQVLPVTEVISKNDFFDYQAKYTEGLASEITPAPITAEQSSECRRLTEYMYRKFNCKGVVRFDYFLVDNEWWFLEVNTVPGFSAESIIPKQAKAAGFNLMNFYGALVEESLRDKALRES
jgi:D-alanine-D-alanine ligase